MRDAETGPDDGLNKTESNVRVKLTKEAKDGHAGNSKTLMEKTEQDTKKRENVQSSWKGKITLLTSVSRFNAVPIKIPMAFSTKTERKP